MSNRNMSTMEATFFTFLIFIGICFVLSLFGVGRRPKCAHAGCQAEVSESGSYCCIHRPSYRFSTSKSYNTTNSSTNSSSTNKSGSSNSTKKTGSSSNTNKNNVGSSTKTSSSKSSSTSSGTKKYNNHDSYDDGYDDVYMDDDYDWDRYYKDDDYARGVDDAIEDMEEDGEWY